MDRNFFKRLQIVLIEKKWNQTRLAEKTGIDIGTISRWKKKGTVPTHNSLQRIIKATGCNLEWLRDGEGDIFQNQSGSPNVQIGNGNVRQQNSSFSVHGPSSDSQPIYSTSDQDLAELLTLLQEFETRAGIKKLIKKYRAIKEDYEE